VPNVSLRFLGAYEIVEGKQWMQDRRALSTSRTNYSDPVVLVVSTAV